MFKVGTKVRHQSTGKVGEVLDAWFDGVDNRYIVKHSNQLWSIPEWALKCIKKRNKINTAKS